MSTLQSNVTYLKSLTQSQTPVSSLLLNYVEEVEIDGVYKTVFYSETNTNFTYGDRVFIVNGNYDSDTLVSNNKYAQYTDGYIVLGVDNCRIILDIPFTNTIPYNDNIITNLLNVYNIETQREFDYINSINIGLSYSTISGIYNKFSGTYSGTTASIYSNSIIYAASAFSASSTYDNLNYGITQSGFYLYNNGYWINITTPFLNNNISFLDTSILNKLYIEGNDIIYNNIIFKESNVYYYKNSWVNDVTHKQPFITKSNFRRGAFNGIHKHGVFGSYNSNTYFNNGTWTGGIIINSNWLNGRMQAPVNNNSTYYAKLINGKPVQTKNFSNNNGYGFNYGYDTNFYSGTIVNGTFTNMNIGNTASFDAIDFYYTGNTASTINLTGNFSLSNINNSIVNNSVISGSVLNNNSITASKLTNNFIANSASDNCEINGDSGININSADYWSYDKSNGTTSIFSTTLRGVIKLFISDSDAEILKSGNVFYLTKINKDYILSSLSDDYKILLPIETRYILDRYHDYELDDNIVVSIKDSYDNSFKTVATNIGGMISNILTPYTPSASIDIECNKFGYYMDGTNIVYINNILSPININNINNVFSNQLINNFEYGSGIVINSTWNSGDNINYYNNIIPNNIVTGLAITQLSNNSVQVTLKNNTINSYPISYEDLEVGNYVWLKNIQYNGTTQIDGRCLVIGVVNGTDITITLKLLDTTIPNGTTYFSSNAVYDSYTSLNKLLIANTTINNGLLKRTGLSNNTFINDSSDNTDTTLNPSNNYIRLVNNILNDGIVTSGIVYLSHVLNTEFNAIVYKSFWKGATFSSGVFNNGSWFSGTFNNGNFINSNATQSSVFGYSIIPLYNNWQTGTFNAGSILNSVVYQITFNSGKILKSDVRSGTINNGIIGDKSIPYNFTTIANNTNTPDYNTYLSNYFGSSTILNSQVVLYNATVNNALLGGNGALYIHNIVFNAGQITSFGATSGSTETIWFGGDFYNGSITGLTRWKNGTFHNGLFQSIYGYSNVGPINPSTYSTDYAWENGYFLNGIFGNSDLIQNSVWFSGDFEGGVFNGRFWYSGIMVNATMNGSAVTNISEYNAVMAFTQSYYGLWYSGIVTDYKYNFKTTQQTRTNTVRVADNLTTYNAATLNNILWINGTFSHKNGSINNSYILNINMYDGYFNSGIINPYVDRSFSNNLPSYSTQSIWNNGYMNNGSMYNTVWNNGIVNNGYMSGVIFNAGTINYVTAENIYFVNGLWRNGNWNGSPFDSTYVTSSNPYQIYSKAYDIINYVSSFIGTSSIHIINAFTSSGTTNLISNTTITNTNVSNLSVYESDNYPVNSNINWVYDQTYTYNNLSTSIWNIAPSYILSASPNNVTPTKKTILSSNAYTTGGTIPPKSPKPPFYNGYNDSNTISYSDSAPSSPLYAAYGGTLSVFNTANTTYTISLTIAVEYANNVVIVCGVGGNAPQTFTLSSNTYIYSVSNTVRVGSPPFTHNVTTTETYIDNLANVYNLSFTYNTTNALLAAANGANFYIQKISNGILRIISATINEQQSFYHPSNNTLYNGVNFTLPNLKLEANADNGQIVSVNYGNGVFKSGIWENGVWNNGYRGDWFNIKDVFRLTGIYFGSTYQTSTNSWIITFNVFSNTEISGINIGDKVAISNIVAIDTNENRNLISDFYKVTYIDTAIVQVSLNTNLRIKRFEQDSPNHLIYITKNIWLSGAFLNGYFNGVWNNGLFKGYPMITTISDSHWINGTFDGGHFISNQVVDNLTYNSGLVQYFNFSDNNEMLSQVSNYDSWMDVTYYDGTLTEIYTNYQVISESQTLTKEDVTYNVKNMVGYPTYDVLSSVSSFKDYIGTNINNYNLGTKYKKYTQLNPTTTFNKPFSNVRTQIGLSNFTGDGWDSYNYYTSQYASQSYVLESNLNINNFGLLTFSTSSNANSDAVNMDIDIENYNYANILTNRYSVVEIVFGTYSVINEYNGFDINYNNVDNYRYLNDVLLDSNELPGIIGINSPDNYSLFDTDPIKKRYFYNRDYLGLLLTFQCQAEYSLGFTVSVSNIGIYETDMIPFFIYATESGINTNIRAPLYGVAPYIDYTKNNFDFVGNIVVNFDSVGIASQNTTINQSGGVSGVPSSQIINSESAM